MGGIIASARATGVRVNVLLTGDCGSEGAAATLGALDLSSQVVIKRIAQETGGRSYFIPGGTEADFSAALNEIFASIAHPTVVNDVAPTVALSVTPGVIRVPNHEMVTITPTVSATDNINPAHRIEFVGVSVSEPADGQGDGKTARDVEVSTDGTIRVRADRSGWGTGRPYTITYRATDAAGNIGYASATVTVPRGREASEHLCSDFRAPGSRARGTPSLATPTTISQTNAFFCVTAQERGYDP